MKKLNNENVVFVYWNHTTDAEIMFLDHFQRLRVKNIKLKWENTGFVYKCFNFFYCWLIEGVDWLLEYAQICLVEFINSHEFDQGGV